MATSPISSASETSALEAASVQQASVVSAAGAGSSQHPSPTFDVTSGASVAFAPCENRIRTNHTQSRAGGRKRHSSWRPSLVGTPETTPTP